MARELETRRLTLRAYRPEDLEAVFSLLSDVEVNRFLPWHPLRDRDEAERLLAWECEARALYHWAVCRKEDGVLIGYVHAGRESPYDLGYGLCRRFWGQGVVPEACFAVIERLKADGVPFITATHDVNNPQSGRVMQKLGMRYCYTYREQWQPKNIPVNFRMYQLNLDGASDRTYQGYWEKNPDHWIERGL